MCNELTKRNWPYPFQEFVGIDYYSPFLEIAECNLKKCHNEDVKLLLADMSEFKDYMKNSVVFLYNPAGGKIIDDVRQNIENSCEKAVVIYNKPEHEDVFESWRVISRKTHRDRDHCTTVFGWNV